MGEAAIPSPEATLPPGVALRLQDGALRIALSEDLYGVDAIFRTCYWLTDRGYVYVARSDDRHVEVTLLAKAGNGQETNQLAWEFLNELIDQRQRVAINQETRTVRELIVAQAFADADLIDDRGQLLDAGQARK